VLCHAQYAMIASFLLDTDSVFAAAIGSFDGIFLAEMINMILLVNLGHRIGLPEREFPETRAVMSGG
jgi:hypothetical protein